MTQQTINKPRARPLVDAMLQAFSWPGMILGGLSIIVLAIRGFNIGLVGAIGPVVEEYEKIMQTLFGWAEPLLNAELARLRDWFRLDLEVYPHWKHVFVLLALYFVRNVIVTFTSRGVITGLVRFVWAIIIAIVTSVAVGAVSLAHDYQSSALIALIPVAGVTLFDIGNDIWGSTFFRAPGEGWWRHFFFETELVLARAIVAVAIVLFGLTWPPVMETENPGLLLLGVLVVLFSFYWIWLGSLWPKRNRDGNQWRNTDGREGAMRLGRSMLGSLAGAVGFLGANAGLRFLGL